MAGRPPKTLEVHVLENTFRARRHYPLLAGAELQWPGFALIQARYRAATSQPERRAIAVEFQSAVKLAHQTFSDRVTATESGRYPGTCPEGSEGIDDGRSRSSSSEDALSHHPHTQPQQPSAEVVATPESPIKDGSA